MAKYDDAFTGSIAKILTDSQSKELVSKLD